MGMSVRLAPGVRVRVSSRGVRTSIGPRVARVHVGGGRTGVSTGVGPFGFYAPVTGGGRSTRPTAARSGPTPAQTAKLERAQQIDAATRRLTSLHQVQFDAARAPVAAASPPVDRTSVVKRHRAAARRGVPWFDLRNRRLAAEAARTRAESELAGLVRAAEAERAVRQEELGRAWTALCANDEEAVLDALSAAFEDNAAPAAPLAVVGDCVHVAVLSPGEAVVPGEMAGVTPTGQPSVRRATKAHRAEVYRNLVAGILLITAREAFAVAPGIREVAVVAVESDSGVPRAVAAAHLERRALGAATTEVSAEALLARVATDLQWVTKGSAKSLVALPDTGFPGLADLLRQLRSVD